MAQLLAKETRDGQEIVSFALGVLRGRTVEPPKGKAKHPRVKVWSEKSRLWAAEWCADRLWGKAKQVVELEHGKPAAPPLNYDALTDAEVDALDQLLSKAMARPADLVPALPAPAQADAIPAESTEE